MEVINNVKRIALAGASGVGKTTLAKGIWDRSGKEYEQIILYVDGSTSTIIPETKDMPHREMLKRDVKALQMEDYKILNLRKKLFEQDPGDSIVSDRSFLDSAAYFIYKQADKLESCEVDHFVNLCKMCTCKLYTHLIFVDFTPYMFREWVTEDNNKRITSNYFQMEISYIMKMVLDLWVNPNPIFSQEVRYLKEGLFFKEIPLRNGAISTQINSVYGDTKVLILRESDIDLRNKLIDRFIDGKI